MNIVYLEDHLNNLIGLGYIGANEVLKSFQTSIPNKLERYDYEATNTGNVHSIEDSFNITYAPTKKVVGYLGILVDFPNKKELYLTIPGSSDKSTCISCKNYIRDHTSVKTCNRYKAMNGNNAVNVVTNIGQIKWYFDQVSKCSHV